MRLGLILIVCLSCIPLSGQQLSHFIPTSEVVRIATMAARDEGFVVGNSGTYLDELRTADGKEPIPGYTSIGLYKQGHIVRSYSIRVETGDVLDATACKLFRYPDLLKFKRSIMGSFGTKDATDERLASEVGCAALTVLPKKTSKTK